MRTWSRVIPYVENSCILLNPQLLCHCTVKARRIYKLWILKGSFEKVCISILFIYQHSLLSLVSVSMLYEPHSPSLEITILSHLFSYISHFVRTSYSSSHFHTFGLLALGSPLCIHLVLLIYLLCTFLALTMHLLPCTPHAILIKMSAYLII